MSKTIVDAYELLKDIVNADDNGEPYTGRELQDISAPIIAALAKLLPVIHPDSTQTKPLERALAVATALAH